MNNSIENIRKFFQMSSNPDEKELNKEVLEEELKSSNLTDKDKKLLINSFAEKDDDQFFAIDHILELEEMNSEKLSKRLKKFYKIIYANKVKNFIEIASMNAINYLAQVSKNAVEITRIYHSCLPS